MRTANFYLIQNLFNPFSFIIRMCKQADFKCLLHKRGTICKIENGFCILNIFGKYKSFWNAISLKAFNFFYVCIDVYVVIFRYFITTYLRYRASKQMFEWVHNYREICFTRIKMAFAFSLIYLLTIRANRLFN